MKPPTEFTPAVTERDTDELIGIVYAPAGDYQEEFVRQAKAELIRRGVTQEEQDAKIQEWARAEKEAERLAQIERMENAQKVYPLGKKIAIFLGAPFVLLGRTYLWESYSELKQENFVIMARQRLILLVGGVIFYVLLIFIFFSWIN